MTDDGLREHIADKMAEIHDELDRVYGRIAGFKASEIVDIWFECTTSPQKCRQRQRYKQCSAA